jgi:hypothetical protein
MEVHTSLHTLFSRRSAGPVPPPGWYCTYLPYLPNLRSMAWRGEEPRVATPARCWCRSSGRPRRGRVGSRDLWLDTSFRLRGEMWLEF